MSETWRRWQDWANVVVGVLLFITPFVFGATAQTPFAWTAYIGGILLALAGLWNLSDPSNRFGEWAAVVIGVLVFIAPWVLGFAGMSTLAWSAWIAGVLAVVLAGSVLLTTREHHVPAHA